MKKIIVKTALSLASVMMLTGVPLAGTALAHDDTPYDLSVAAVEYKAGLVYGENGSMVDYVNAGGIEPKIAYPKCSSHDWELVHKFTRGANGVQVKVYNRRCKKCFRYKYTTWSYSPVS